MGNLVNVGMNSEMGKVGDKVSGVQIIMIRSK